MNIDFRQPYFNMTLHACRRAGARGGRAAARNRRLRHHTWAAQPAREVQVHQETAHEASLLLDAQFPHLRGAFVPRGARR